MTKWLSGSVTLWLSGSVTLWLSGSVAQWFSGSVAQWLCGSVAQWLSDSVIRALDSRLKDLRFESWVVVSNHGQVRSVDTAPVLSCMNEYLAVDSGGYFVRSFQALIVA